MGFPPRFRAHADGAVVLGAVSADVVDVAGAGFAVGASAFDALLGAR